MQTNTNVTAILRPRARDSVMRPIHLHGHTRHRCGSGGSAEACMPHTAGSTARGGGRLPEAPAGTRPRHTSLISVCTVVLLRQAGGGATL
jgi:hypothetical protein